MNTIEVTNPHEIPYVVYWIRPKDREYDIMTDGYVGITHQFTRRIGHHMSNEGSRNQNKFIYENLKTQELIVSIVFRGDMIEVLEEEKRLRPVRNIGWNTAVGGYSTTQNKFEEDGLKKFKLIPSKESWKRGMNVWSDEDKIRIGKQHKGKVISEAQKLKSKATYEQSIKDGLNKVVKAITLEEYGTKKLYSFNSITEASRILGIHHSNLKSMVLRRVLNRVIGTMFRVRFDMSSFDITDKKPTFNPTTTTIIQIEETNEIVDIASPLDISGLYDLPANRNSFTSRRAYNHYKFKDGWRLLDPTASEEYKTALINQALS